MDADDWLRVIQRKLEPFECQDRDKVLLAAHQLTGTALAWWENYCATAEDASTITWKEFVKEFCRYHIPSATMKCKADEFCALQQGSMSVEEYTHQFMELARYAPEEVNDDEKKQDMFKKGLNPELRTLLTPQIYPDFNTLMNKVILTVLWAFGGTHSRVAERTRLFPEGKYSGKCQEIRPILLGGKNARTHRFRVVRAAGV